MKHSTVISGKELSGKTSLAFKMSKGRKTIYTLGTDNEFWQKTCASNMADVIIFDGLDISSKRDVDFINEIIKIKSFVASPHKGFVLDEYKMPDVIICVLNRNKQEVELKQDKLILL